MSKIKTITTTFKDIPIKNRAFVVCLLLVVSIVFFAVPLAQADLPPEVYYQGTNTGVNGDDHGTGALPIGFNFTFYGNTYNKFYATSNGMITFSDYRQIAGWGNWPHYVNSAIPNTNWPNNYIAAFWDDTTAYNNLNERVLYKTLGTAPNRKLVVQYTNVGFYNDPTPLGTFFIILYEGSNNIQLQYRYLIGDNARAHGSSATIGLENANGSAGTQYAFNTQSLQSEQVILFSPNGSGGYTTTTSAYEPVLLGLGATPAPDIPIQTAPLKGSTVSTAPTFSWGAAENATSYEIRVDNNPNMGSLEISQTGLTEPSFTPTTPLAEGIYYWIVIAHNESDQAWSQQWNFTASHNPPPPLPGVPLLVAPNQDETEVSLTPTFSWQTASYAAEYQLIVSEQADLSSPLIDEAGIMTTSFEAAGLTADTLYYWTVVASNVTGSTQSSVRSFTSLHINRAPTAVADSLTIAEDSGTISIDVLANDSDPDRGDTLSIVSVSTPDQGGTAVIHHNQINYTPALNFFGTETFTYTISDGQGGSDTATVTIEVTSVNDLPIANDDFGYTTKNSGTIQLDVLANDSDPDIDDILTLISVSTPDQGGTAVINQNQIDYTPALNFYGTETFTYTISDGQGGTDTALVTIEVAFTNAAPIANDDQEYIVSNSGAIQLNVLANDSDPDADHILTLISVSTPDQGGTAVINGSLIDYIPAPNFAGIETFTYNISDGHGGEATATVTIHVQADTTNSAPQAQDDTVETLEDTPLIIYVLNNDSDPENDVLSIKSISTPAHGTAVIQGSTIRYTPHANYHGPDSFNYTVSDGEFTDSATVYITVISVNDLPQAGPDTATTMAGQPVVIHVLENDSDPVEGSSLVVTAVSKPAHGKATTNGVTVTYTPNPGFTGTETFTYTLSDGTDSVTGTITVTVNPYQVFIPLVIR